MSAPAASLDSRVQCFLSQLSPLVERVEQRLRQEETSIASPSIRWHAAVDAVTGRQYYHTRSGRLVTWQQPAVFLPALQSAASSSLPSAALVSVPDPPPPLESASSPRPAFSRVDAAVRSLRDRLQQLRPHDTESAAAGGGSMRLQWELCQCELSIRWEDWKARAVQEEYVMHRLQLLADSLERRLTAETNSAVDGAAIVEPDTAADSPAQAAASPFLVSAASQAAASSASFLADAITAAPVPVRRPAFSISKPPSQPVEELANTSSAAALLPPDSSKRGREEASGDLRRVKARKQPRKGAVHAMMDRWKAVRQETERDEQQAEAVRGREEAQRIAQCEQQVRRAAANAGRDNPNLAPLGDWRARVRAAREQQSSADAG